MRRIMQFTRGQRGFTLIELLTVAAIMAVLSAIVFPAVSGTTTTSRESTQSVDINSVQTAADRYNQDTGLNSTAAFSVTPAGDLATGLATGTGILADPFLFSNDDLAGVDFVVLDTSYLRNLPDHNAEVLTVLAGAQSSVLRIVRGGADVHVQLDNPTGGSLDFPAWGVDASGVVWVFVDADVY